MTIENLLVVCFDIKDFKNIHKIDLSKYEKVVVASDDFRVHEEAEKFEFVDDVTFLQKAIPYTKVADDVIRIIDKANLFYQQVEEKLQLYKREYMQLPLHVEGGDFTQHIQDLLLYIESLNRICVDSNISQIIILKNSEKFVSNIIEQYSNAKKVNFDVIKKTYINVNKKYLKYRIRPFINLFRTIYIKFLFMFEPKHKEKNVSLILLFSTTKKHIDNCLQLDSFMKRAKYNSLLYSWKIGKIFDDRLKENIKLERIEKYLPWHEIFKSIYLSINSISNCQKLNKIFNSYSFLYNDIDLKNLLASIIIDYILIEVPDTYRFAKGFENFYNNLDLKLIDGYLDSFKIGKPVYSIVPINDISKYMFSVFIMGKNVYVKENRQRQSKDYWDKFIFFVQNKNEKDIVVDEVAVLKSKTCIYGSFRSSGFFSETKIEAKKLYKISKNYKYYVLYDFGSPLFGYVSLGGILSTLYMLVDFIQKNQDICLIVKPHPSADISVINSIKNNIDLENCIFLKREANVNYALVLSDIVITKYSTIGIEAMKCNSLVVSYQYDGSETFKVYGENGNYVYSLLDLENELKKIVANIEYKNIQLKKQKEFYIKNFSKEVDFDVVVENLIKIRNI